MEPEWKDRYIRYGEFKILLKQIRALNEELASKNASPNTGPGVHARRSLDAPERPHQALALVRGDEAWEQRAEGRETPPSEEAFFEALDEDVVVRRVHTLERLKRRVEERG